MSATKQMKFKKEIKSRIIILVRKIIRLTQLNVSCILYDLGRHLTRTIFT